ncbi:MAG: hypothetical protein ACTHOD_00985 [Motilibacteraceae bacterium]
MNDLDRSVLDDLAGLPGWDELTASPAGPPPGALERATAAVRVAIAADASLAATGDLVARRTHPTRRRRARWVSAVVAAAAATALVVGGPTIGTGSNPPVAVASATEFLTRLASTAAAAPGVDDAYWKVRFTTTYDEPGAPAGSGQPTTVWFGRHGGRWITSPAGAVVKASDRAPFVVGERVALTWGQVAGLPSDPGQLQLRLRSMLGQTPIATGAAQLLTVAPLTAAQRAALFTILARQPGVTIRAGVEDEAGRTGTALGFPFSPAGTPVDLVTLLLADDGTVLQVTETAVKDQEITSRSGPDRTTRKGDIISRTTYLEAGGTDTAPGA